MLTALLLSFVPFVAADRREPDLIVLTSGQEVECRVLYEDDQEVVYSAKRKEQRKPRAEVKEVQSIERSMNEFLQRYEQTPPTDVAALAQLAQFAEDIAKDLESKGVLRAKR